MRNWEFSSTYFYYDRTQLRHVHTINFSCALIFTILFHVFDYFFYISGRSPLPYYRVFTCPRYPLICHLIFVLSSLCHIHLISIILVDIIYFHLNPSVPCISPCYSRNVWRIRCTKVTFLFHTLICLLFRNEYLVLCSSRMGYNWGVFPRFRIFIIISVPAYLVARWHWGRVFVLHTRHGYFECSRSSTRRGWMDRY